MSLKLFIQYNYIRIIMNSTHDMYVTKRNGTREIVSFDKILTRVKKMGHKHSGKQLNINYTELVIKIIDQLYDGIETKQIDELTAEQCASMASKHPDYSELSGRIIISNHHKNTDEKYTNIIERLYNFKDKNNNKTSIISQDLYDVVNKYEKNIQSLLDYNRDYLIDYFGFKTLERSYLLRVNNTVVERPQHMWMRVSIGIHGDNIEKIEETYNLMSEKYFTHATPTLFNAGTPRPQLSSCYLLASQYDSISGIYDTLKECALISKYAGGIGVHIHNIRSKGSLIRSTNGYSDGIVPMLRVFNSTARYVNQSGKRNGSFAIYLEPWHADIENFLEMKKNHGDEEMKGRDLFYALWIPDLFMERVKENKEWTLMCPDICKGLSNVCGNEFKELYETYEKHGKGNKTIPARKLWFQILDSQIETGTPYMLYKDAANKKSNQKNLGVIKSSNLCSEIIEYSDKDETAVCNLASIGLPSFVEENKQQIKYMKENKITIYSKTGCIYCKLSKLLLNKYNIEFQEILLDDERKRNEFYQKQHLTNTDKRMNSVPQIFINDELLGDYNKVRQLLRPNFNYEKLHKITRVITYNLNRVIDVNFYPTERTKRSNFRHRPIGIGVQGLADVFAKMDTEFDSVIARNINKQIFETIYHAALEESCHIAKKETPYETFKGSPASNGILQFDMWNTEPSDRYDWNDLKEEIKRYGLRNSLLVAPMPTASTSQILGNNECFEPYTSNIYTRRTLAGDFVILNKYLLQELIELGLWNDDMKNEIIYQKGSIQSIETIPQVLRNKYKIAWEIPMRSLIDMARDRGIYICQSQSLNLWMENPSYDKLTAMHFYAWKQGLKTGIYYLRTKAKAAAQQFTIDPSKKKNSKNHIDRTDKSQDEEVCEMCSG